MAQELEAAAALAASYLLGSIPFGLLLSRLAGLGDIRQIGSGNIGATNVLRTGNKWVALATLLCDAGKGAAAVAVVRAALPDQTLLPAGAALAAILGHIFPLWLKFKGGKSVATALGGLAVLAWPVALGAGLTWLAVAALFRYSSLAGLAAMATAPFLAWIFLDGKRAIVVAMMAILVCARHHGNIRRLLDGEEPRIGRSGNTPPA